MIYLAEGTGPYQLGKIQEADGRLQAPVKGNHNTDKAKGFGQDPLSISGQK